VAAGKTSFGKQLLLLPGPDNGFLPPTIELEGLAKHGLGKCEIEAHKN